MFLALFFATVPLLANSHHRKAKAVTKLVIHQEKAGITRFLITQGVPEEKIKYFVKTTANTIREGLVTFYMKNFTKEELKEIIRFINSSTQKKIFTIVISYLMERSIENSRKIGEELASTFVNPLYSRALKTESTEISHPESSHYQVAKQYVEFFPTMLNKAVQDSIQGLKPSESIDMEALRSELYSLIKEDFIQLYMEYFTEEELLEANIFYLTETGRKWLEIEHLKKEVIDQLLASNLGLCLAYVNLMDSSAHTASH